MPLPSQDPAELVALAKEGRALRGWSQRLLAAKIGVSQPSIYQLEKGNHKAISEETLEKLFKVFADSPVEQVNTIHLLSKAIQPITTGILGMCTNPACYAALPVEVGAQIGVVPLVVVDRERCPVCHNKLETSAKCDHPILAKEPSCPECGSVWFEEAFIETGLSPELSTPLALQEIIERMIGHRIKQLKRLEKIHLVPWAKA